MKEIVDLANDLDPLDKAAWTEIIAVAESKMEEKLEVVVAEGEKSLLKVLEEIAPFIKIIRLGLASDTISGVSRSRLVSIIISEISGLLSPVELAGVCFAIAANGLRGTERRTMVMAIPFPFRDMELEKKDETKTVV